MWVGGVEGWRGDVGSEGSHIVMRRVREADGMDG